MWRLLWLFECPPSVIVSSEGKQWELPPSIMQNNSTTTLKLNHMSFTKRIYGFSLLGHISFSELYLINWQVIVKLGYNFKNPSKVPFKKMHLCCFSTPSLSQRGSLGPWCQKIHKGKIHRLFRSSKSDWQTMLIEHCGYFGWLEKINEPLS